MSKIKLALLIGGTFLIIGVVGAILTFDDVKRTVTTEKGQIDNPFNSIHITSEIAQIDIIRMDTNEKDAKLEVTSANGMNIDSAMEIKGDTLFVTLTEERNNLIQFDFNFSMNKAILYLPKKDYEKLYIDGEIGTLDVEGLSVAKLEAYLDNGTIHLNNIDSPELIASVENGDIKLNTDDIERMIDLKVENGRVYVQTEQPPKNVTFDMNVEIGTTKIMNHYGKDEIIGDGDHLVQLKVENGMIVLK